MQSERTTQARIDQGRLLSLVWVSAILSLGVVITTTWALFRLPEKPAAPRKLAVTESATPRVGFRFTEPYYQSIVAEDSDRVRIPRPSVEELKRPNAFRVELDSPEKLPVGKSLRTASLAVYAVAKPLWIGAENQGLRAKHLVLRVTNQTNKYLAYKVVTAIEHPCAHKGVLSQNALTLRPGETEERSECLLESAKSLQVKSVEVLELSPLGYYYVGRLDPMRLLFDARTSAGHEFTALPPCRTLPWREILRGMRSEETDWQDVADFYSRHSCDEYSFFVGYRWTRAGVTRLPVLPAAGSVTAN